MVSWITAGQVRRMLEDSNFDTIRFDTGEYLYFGNNDVFQQYYNGSEFIIEGVDDSAPYLKFGDDGYIDLGLEAGETFSVYNTDRAIFSVDVADVLLETYTAATVGNVFVHSLPLRFRGHWWNGASSQNADVQLRNHMFGASQTNVELEIKSYDDNVCFIRPATVGTYIYGSDTNAESLYLYANTVNTYPYIRIHGSNDIELRHPEGQRVSFYNEGTRYARFEGNMIRFTPTNTSDSSFFLEATAQESAPALYVLGTSITSGDGILVNIDSDIVTTGFGYRLNSGSGGGTTVFSVDEDGIIDCYKPDGTSRLCHFEHLGASVASAGGSGATQQVLNAVLTYKLDAIGEYLYYATIIHSDWDASSDLTLIVGGYLTNAEAANNNIRMSIKCDYGTEGDNANTFKTQTITATHDIESDNAQYDFHILEFTMDHDLVANVLEVGDVIGIRIWLNDVSSGATVSGFNVMGLGVKYNSSKVRCLAE